MIRFKEGVNPYSVHPAIWIAVGIAAQIFASITGLPMIVTSMNDGTHAANSLHYPSNSPDGLCRAVDLRTHDLAIPARNAWAGGVTRILNRIGFDVVHHTGTDGVPAHLHIEWQPKANEIDWTLPQNFVR